ncbi:glutathione S-transferase N-terminal domain-containing protein [Halosegnis marinus]|uniref:Glutathione S-transferase N-terminal domain-containing protein n=1 Tax=Halosegnis marinus TaxID=3034023 RepID=A0ABD5ZRW4_9EURY|nr:glutathione S-transferase N-terminal domain-containing protein [Halosegnis sp. DT85]
MSEPLTLYRLEGCPFCELVVDELDDLGLEYDSVWTEGLHSKRNAVREVSGQRAVPVLIDPAHGVTMAESANIVEYLHTTYGDADSPDEVEVSL